MEEKLDISILENLSEETMKNIDIKNDQVIHTLMKCFERSNMDTKKIIIEILGRRGDQLSISYLKQIIEKESENYIIKALSEGELDRLQRKEEVLNRKIRKLENQLLKSKKLNTNNINDALSDIAMIGAIGNASTLNKLMKLTKNIQSLKEQVEISELHILRGTEAILKEYRSQDSKFKKEALLEAIYCAYETNDREKIVPIILEDLFSSDYIPLFNSLLRLSDKDFPKEKINQDSKNRLFSILEGNYKADLKDYAAKALGNLLTAEDAIYIKRLESMIKKLNSRNKVISLLDFNGNHLKEILEASLKKITTRLKKVK
ncbi:hypothetical protein A8F94_12920 [Bacillus sp. FJAT-27225]|uniref:hypothetical protein n=1 Tax=Bacillus sp. FJAT-27225 TaxID=1743144 RepID=UPI00080C20EC|nr:hypothetical protein [Bacillus sp. FJAT-27225]OCA85769.1 hypothetical protein A8F94_12920 [Bacillus sp. FJAT-27225]